MSASEIWSNYIRYIGTGAVAAGGIISLVKSLPTIIGSFIQVLSGIGGKESGKVERINVEAPLYWVVGAAAFGFFATWFIPAIGGGLLGGVSAIVFSFFFAVVSARMVGIIGSSSNPVSGMTIATLLVVTTLLKITGVVGDEEIKTALLIGGVVLLLDKAYELGSVQVAAPQASLMRLIVEGIMSAQIPWTLVIVGAAIAIFCAMAGISILAESNLLSFIMFMALGTWVYIFAIKKNKEVL